MAAYGKSIKTAIPSRRAINPCFLEVYVSHSGGSEAEHGLVIPFVIIFSRENQFSIYKIYM